MDNDITKQKTIEHRIRASSLGITKGDAYDEYLFYKYNPSEKMNFHKGEKVANFLLTVQEKLGELGHGYIKWFDICDLGDDFEIIFHTLEDYIPGFDGTRNWRYRKQT